MPQTRRIDLAPGEELEVYSKTDLTMRVGSSKRSGRAKAAGTYVDPIPPVVTPPPVIPGPEPPLKTAKIGPSDGQDALTQAVRDLTLVEVELAPETYPWDHVNLDADRGPVYPLRIRPPLAGGTAKFVGDGATTEGVFFVGDKGKTSYITLDGVRPDGFLFEGIELSACGIFEVRSSDHCSFKNMTYQGLRRSPVWGNPSAPYKSWCFYISMGGGVRNNADLYIGQQTVHAPAERRTHSFANNGSSTLVNGNITFEDIDLESVCYALYADVANTVGSQLILNRWKMHDVGVGLAQPANKKSIRFTAKSISGRYSNILGSQTEPIENSSTAQMVKGENVLVTA